MLPEPVLGTRGITCNYTQDAMLVLFTYSNTGILTRKEETGEPKGTSHRQ